MVGDGSEKEESMMRRNGFMIYWQHQEEGVCEGSFKTLYCRSLRTNAIF